MLLLGGEAFLPATYSLKIIAILVIINPTGSWQINQVLLPHRKEKLAFNAQILISIIIAVLNLIFVPKYSYIWVIVEFILLIIESKLIRRNCKEIRIHYFNKSMIKYSIASIAILLLKRLLSNNFITLLILIGTGAITYFSVILILKNNIGKAIFLELKNKMYKLLNLKINL